VAHEFNYAPPHRTEALSDDVRLTSDGCLSVAYIYIGPKSRTERLRKTKIGTEIAHVPRDSDTTFKVKDQRSTCRWAGHNMATSLHSLFNVGCARSKYDFGRFTGLQ